MLYVVHITNTTRASAERSSSIRSVFAWHASGPEFDPHVRHSPLPLPLIQEEQLSVTGKKFALSTGKLPRRLAQEQCG